MRILITVIILAVTIAARTQPSLDIFEDYTPKWIHGTFDTTALDIVGYNDRSRMRPGGSMMKDNNIYTFFRYNLQNDVGDGGYIESINVETGEERWRTFYDLRTIDINERPNRMRLKDNGEIEVIGARYLEKKTGGSATPYNTMVIRKYDQETGELTNWNITDPEDSLNTRFSNSTIDEFVYFYTDELFQIIYTSPGHFRKFIPSLILDTLGHKIRGDTSTMWENDYSTQATVAMHFIDDTTMVTTLEAFDSRYPVDFRYWIKVYNRELKELKSIELTDDLMDSLRDSWLELKYADDKYVIINFTRYYYGVGWKKHDYIYDYEGNLLDSIDLHNNNLTFSRVKRISDDEFLVVGQDARVFTEDFSLHIYRKKIGGELVLLRRIPMRTPERLLYVDKIHLTKSNDIILVSSYHLVDFKNYSTKSLFPVTVCFSAGDIDITSTSAQVAEVPELIIHPNPATHSITISHGYEGEARIEVLDVMGRVLIGKKVMSAGEDELDVSVLNAGVYAVRVLDRRGVVVGRGKFVRR